MAIFESFAAPLHKEKIVLPVAGAVHVYHTSVTTAVEPKNKQAASFWPATLVVAVVLSKGNTP